MRGGGVEHAEVAREVGGDDTLLVHRAGHDAAAPGREDVPGGAVARLLHPRAVPRPQDGSRDQVDAVAGAPGDQHVLRAHGHPSRPAQVVGQQFAQARVPVGVDDVGGRPVRRAAPGTPPGRPVVVEHPRPPGTQVYRPPARNARRRLALGVRWKRLCAGVPGAPGGGREAGEVGHIGAGAVPSLQPPLGVQLLEGLGDDGAADAQQPGEPPAGRQALAGLQRARPHAVPQLVAELHGQWDRRFPVEGEGKVDMAAQVVSRK